MAPAPVDSDELLDADVEEFARHDRKGGWARALLVARRVELGEGQGERTDLRPRYGRNEVFRRISAKEFAQRSKTSTQRILAFYDAWRRAAADKKVPSFEKLTPGIHVDLPDEDEVPFFGEHGYYRCYQARMGNKERRQAIEQEAERAGVKPTAPVYVAQQPTALKAAILADPTARAAAKAAIEEFERRQAQADQGDRDTARHVTSKREQEFDAAGGATGVREEDAELVAAVRAARHQPETDAALQVFTEMTTVRLATLRTLSLLQQHPVTFSGERSKTLADLCDAAKAAIDFIRDLATSHHTALNDAALRAFLEESEKLR
ncbi:hypothetical protein ACH4UT_33540 [Streptomyces sp. NPDC020799]|uniref:hypothetical protein n=1 Tax=Streptomyces sp. NPDC020799 TaxID=3365091 RepID=UPI00379E9E07